MKQKRYWLRGGVMGLIISVIALIIIEVATKCVGICPRFSAFLPEIIFIYGVFIIGGILLGILIGWLYGKIKNRNKDKIL